MRVLQEINWTEQSRCGADNHMDMTFRSGGLFMLAATENIQQAPPPDGKARSTTPPCRTLLLLLLLLLQPHATLFHGRIRESLLFSLKKMILVVCILCFCTESHYSFGKFFFSSVSNARHSNREIRDTQNHAAHFHGLRRRLHPWCRAHATALVRHDGGREPRIESFLYKCSDRCT